MRMKEYRVGRKVTRVEVYDIGPRLSKRITAAIAAGQINPQDIEPKPSGMHAVVWPGDRIRIYGQYSGRTYDKTFQIGDWAEYGSYNLIYDGAILAIGPQTITIDARGTGEGPKRLSLHVFSVRNYNYDRQAADLYNAEEMHSI